MIGSLKRYRRSVTAEKILASKSLQDELQLVLLKIHLSLVTSWVHNSSVKPMTSAVTHPEARANQFLSVIRPSLGSFT